MIWRRLKSTLRFVNSVRNKMNRNRYSIVFDFETDGKSPDTCNIVQIAAAPIDLRNLTILKDDIFCLDVRPDEMVNADYYDKHEDTIKWHASIMGNTVEDVMDRWRLGYSESDAWEEFARFIKNFSKGSKWDSLPIPAGQNIRGYDLPICDRYAKKYKGLGFSKRDSFDLMDFTRIWFMFDPRAPSSLSLDTLRDFFGIDKAGAHDARKDVLDCCHILLKFLGLHERIAPNIKWNPAATEPEPEPKKRPQEV